MVDSALNFDTKQVAKKYPGLFTERVKKVMVIDEDPFDFPVLRFIQFGVESKALEHKAESCIIISASGMAETGRECRSGSDAQYECARRCRRFVPISFLPGNR